jgi:hypothetical protein
MAKKVSRASAVRVYLRAYPKAKTADVKSQVGRLGYGAVSSSEVSRARKAIKKRPLQKLVKAGLVDPVMPVEVNVAIDFVNQCGGFGKARKVLAFTWRIRKSLKDKFSF